MMENQQIKNFLKNPFTVKIGYDKLIEIFRGGEFD